MPLTAYLDLYLTDGLTKTGEQEMFALIENGDNVQILESYIDKKLRESQNVGEDIAKLRELSFRNIAARIDAQNKPVHRVHFLRTAWFKYAAAVLIIVGAGIYFLTQPKSVKNQSSFTEARNADIQPGANKAILTLSDGRKVELNDNISETIADRSSTIKNTAGWLVYQPVGTHELALPGERSEAGTAGGGRAYGGYNTMSTPPGGKYQLTLSDGTRVWLNAASSITYPITFTSSSREVSITGEVYFEVAQNKSHPFVVKTISDEIKVLGTSFNINSYSNESYTKTSLISGSIKIANKILQPGQAFINGKIIKTNIAQDIAWKNGVFNFENMPFQQVMRQIARWYDIEIAYEKEIPDIELEGKMGMDLTLAQVLETFKDVNIRFKLTERKLIIQP